MAKKDCIHCKNCILKQVAYQEGLINTCKCEEQIQNLSQSQLLKRMILNECEFFEQGTAVILDDVCYDD